MRTGRSAARLSIDMTPMIDIVFQLLIFFILTLQISPPEGGLAIHMPNRTSEGAVTARLPLHVVLIAGKDGALAEVRLNDRRLESIDALGAAVRGILGDDSAAAQSAEAVLHCDANLAYQHTMAAVTAVSGTRGDDGAITPLVGRVRFAPPQ